MTQKKIIIIAGPKGRRKNFAQGGHDVPDEVVRRRFYAGLKNFKTFYRYEVDL